MLTPFQFVAAPALYLLSALLLETVHFASPVPVNIGVPTVSYAMFPPCPSAAAPASPQSSVPPPEIAPFASRAPASTDARPDFVKKKTSSSDSETNSKQSALTLTSN